MEKEERRLILGVFFLVVCLILGLVLVTTLPARPATPPWVSSAVACPDDLIPVVALTFGEGGEPVASVMYRNMGDWYAWRIPRRELVADIKQPPVSWIDFPLVARGK